MLLVCLKGKGDQGVQNPGGQMDRPVSSQYLERLVGNFYTFYTDAISKSHIVQVIC